MRDRTGNCVGVGVGVGVGFLCGVVKISVFGSSCGPRSGYFVYLRGEVVDCVSVVSVVVFSIGWDDFENPP